MWLQPQFLEFERNSESSLESESNPSARSGAKSKPNTESGSSPNVDTDHYSYRADGEQYQCGE